jgi:hypothetical protein
MTELVLLGTAGAPLPVAGRRGISSALVVGERVFVIDCGRGSPSAFADAGLGFPRHAVSEAEWAERAGRGFTGTTTAGRDGLRRTLQRIAPSSP